MKPLFNFLPRWITSSVENKPCKKCKGILTKKNIVGIGLQQRNTEDATVCVEFECPNCKYHGRLSFEMIVQTSVEQLCYLLLEEIQKVRGVETARNLETCEAKGPMTDKEVKAFLKQMNKSSTGEDFLKLIKADQYMTEIEDRDAT